MLIWAFAVCICLVKGRIQVFAGDGDSAEAPLTQNFNFDYMYRSVKLNVCKTAELLANSADPDQMQNNATSDWGLHSMLRPVCPIM